VGFVDVNSYVLIELDDEFLYRTEVSGGRRQELARVAHSIPATGPYLHLAVDVSSTQLVHQYSVQDSVWRVLDAWNRAGASGYDSGTSRTFADGKFGFYILGNEELEIANFRYDPPSR
jgi:hypothetical protein